MSLNKNSIVLVGYSGHGITVGEAAALAGMKLYGYCDLERKSNNPLGLEYLGLESEITREATTLSFLLGIGDNNLRLEIARTLFSQGFIAETVIHPQSSIASDCQIEDGVFVARNAAINSLVKIGPYSIINTGSTIDHECQIGTGCHIAPGTTLCGNVEIGDLALIGAGSVIAPNRTVGEKAIVGLGSVVIRDIPDGEIWAGNPATKIR